MYIGIDKHSRPNPKKLQEEVTKQVVDLMIKNDMKQRDNLVPKACNYIDAYAELTQAKPTNMYSKYGEEFKVLDIIPPKVQAEKEV